MIKFYFKAEIKIKKELFLKPFNYSYLLQNRQFLSLKKPGVEDTNSDGSGEITVSDSGRGGSMEDLHRASVMI